MVLPSGCSKLYKTIILSILCDLENGKVKCPTLGPASPIKNPLGFAQEGDRLDTVRRFLLYDLEDRRTLYRILSEVRVL